MKRRHALKKRVSKRNFHNNAQKTHYFNMQHRVMRGGIRM